jgi:hypothetical protein
MPEDDGTCACSGIPGSRDPEEVIESFVVSISYIPLILIPSLENPIANTYPCIPEEGTPQSRLELIQGKEHGLDRRIFPLRNDAACTLLDEFYSLIEDFTLGGWDGFDRWENCVARRPV